MTKTIQNGGFTNPAGGLLTGNLLLVLSQDAKVAAAPNQVAPIATRIPISAGNIAPTLIYFNDELLPGNTFYTMTAYDAAGNKTYGPEQVSLTGAGPLDLGTLVPLLISPDPLFSNPVLQNPSLAQTITGQPLTMAASAPLNVLGGGSLVGSFSGPATFTGTNTFTGLIQPKNIDNIRYIDPSNSQGWAGTDLAGWVTSAFAAMTQQSGTVIVTSGSYATPSASITIGTAGCPNAPSNGWSQTLIFDSVQMTINNPIKVLCGGYLSTTGWNPFGSWITAGASLGTNPMIDIGDATNGNINAGVSAMRLNCNSLAGCTGIRARGIQDSSFINNNLIQNATVNSLNIDCSTAAGGGNFKVYGNFLAGAPGGTSDELVLNACNGAVLRENTGVSNGSAITGASLKIFGNTNNQGPINVYQFHSEKHTDAVTIDAAATVILDGIDVANGTTNTVHIKSTATGSVFVRMAHNNQGGAGVVILNDVTTTSLSANNPPSPQGVQLDYQWMNAQFEYWKDSAGFHTGTGGSGSPGKLLLAVSAGTPGIGTHFNTSGDSIVSNGSMSFTITVGTGAGTSTGAINLPTATTGWTCWLTNTNRAALIQQTGSTTTSATFTNFGTTFAATNWTNSDVLRGGCTAN